MVTALLATPEVIESLSAWDQDVMIESDIKPIIKSKGYEFNWVGNDVSHILWVGGHGKLSNLTSNAHENNWITMNFVRKPIKSWK